MRIALLFQDGNFVGREYFAGLTAAGRELDLVVAAGRISPESIAREVERTGGLWNPPAIPDRVAVHRFDRLDGSALASLIRAQDIDIAIQGGVGILKPDLIATPKLGFLNVHPGRLPQYRGNACPEWALLNGDDVWATVHMIDAGIDTGPVVCMSRYEPPATSSYAEFRAGLYRHCASMLCDALDAIEAAGPGNFSALLQPQDEAKARYWPPLDANARDKLKRIFASPLPAQMKTLKRPGVAI